MHRERLPRRTFLRLAGGALGAAGLARLGPALAASFPDPGPVTGSTRVHDPSLVKAPNGTYILTHTGDNLSIETSTDRIAWRSAGVVWPNGAPWTTPYTGGSPSLWAPDISFHNGQFYLYYAASAARRHSARRGP